MTVLLLVVFITIFVSALCSLYEATLYSTRMGALEAAAAEKKPNRLAGKMIKMKKNISVPIASILILNTIANTAGATIAGMYAHKVFGGAFVPVFSIVLTLAILIFSEIIPKTFGVVHWRTVWPTIVWPLIMMKYLLYPLIMVIQKFSELLIRGQSSADITEEEILGFVRQGAKQGEISDWESLIIHNIINLENIQIQEVMTPGTVMFRLDEKLTVADALNLAADKGFTRIPVYRDEKENIVGYIIINDLVSSKTLDEPEIRLSSLVKPVIFELETESCLTLLTRFLKKRRHISIVEDEYGSIAGLITLEDIIETILGSEIVDENDTVEDLQKLAIKKKPRRSNIRNLQTE